MRLWLTVPLVVVVLLTVAMMTTSGWDRPPVTSVQTGFRGIAMEEVSNPREMVELAALNQPPAATTPLIIPEGGRTAGEAYENVQVLGHLPEVQFLRLMTAITDWVAPGGPADCGYCHNLTDLASEELYTYRVSRRMLEMTIAINSEWTDHVGETGVTCYTCHRGEPVPAEVWSFGGSDVPEAGGISRGRAGQNIASPAVGMTSLPNDPFSVYLYGDADINVEPPTTFPEGYERSIQETEASYALMVHISEAMGVGCTYCHNTRAFSNWDNATPARATAWYGIRMARLLNVDYVEPLSPILPENRLGPEGDALKVSCATCHMGQALPLNGVSMLADYPSLAGPATAVAAAEPAEEPVTEEPAAEAAEEPAAEEPVAEEAATEPVEEPPAEPTEEQAAEEQATEEQQQQPEK